MNKYNNIYNVMIIKIKMFILCILLSGCHTLYIPEDFAYTEVKTPDFDFAIWQKITDKNADYKVYIEGDGYSFNENGIPTNDPTPRGVLVRELAFGDTHANVIYMARACQFIQHKKCTQKYWTTARFAPEIIAAQAIALKQITGTAPITLVGFSGGAQVAGLISVLYPEIKIHKIITIAGNLDHPAWTQYHQVLPLADSLDLNNYRTQLAQFKQVHYVGTADEVMPPFLNQKFVTDKATIIKVKGATHNNGWQSVIPQIQAY